MLLIKYIELLDNISDLDNQCKFKYFEGLKTEAVNQNHSHGCLIDSPDWLSSKNPMNQTKTKAKEVNPKKIST